MLKPVDRPGRGVYTQRSLQAATGATPAINSSASALARATRGGPKLAAAARINRLQDELADAVWPVDPIRTSSDVTTFAVLFIVGIAVSQLAARIRRLKVLAITDAGHLPQIQETASLAQRATAPHMVIEQVRNQLIGLLDLRDSRFEYGVPVDHPPRPGRSRPCSR